MIDNFDILRLAHAYRACCVEIDATWSEVKSYPTSHPPLADDEDEDEPPWFSLRAAAVERWKRANVAAHRARNELLVSLGGGTAPVSWIGLDGLIAPGPEQRIATLTA